MSYLSNSPLISVIIPIYKVEDYLRECIDSVLGQSYRNLEIILVDDGSPDSCGIIADEYAKRDPRIVVIHKENGGLSDARNAGLDICKGEYISFVDSDDYVHPQFIEILYQALRENNADVSFCDFTYHELKIIREDYSLYNFEDYYLIYDNLIAKTVVWNKLYHKKNWKKLRFKKGKLHEDMFIFHELLFDKIIAGSKSKLYHYRRRNESISIAKTEKNWNDIISALQIRVCFFKQKKYRKLYLFSKNELFYSYVSYYLQFRRHEQKIVLRKNLFYLVNTNFLNMKEKLSLLLNIFFK